MGRGDGEAIVVRTAMGAEVGGVAVSSLTFRTIVSGIGVSTGAVVSRTSGDANTARGAQSGESSGPRASERSGGLLIDEESVVRGVEGNDGPTEEASEGEEAELTRSGDGEDGEGGGAI